MGFRHQPGWGTPEMDGNQITAPWGSAKACLFPPRSLLEQLKKLQAIVVQSTSKSAQTGTCIAVSPGPQDKGGPRPWQKGLCGGDECSASFG